MTAESFERALTAIREGAHYSLCGRTLTVDDIAITITDAQFDIAYDLMDELDGDDWLVVLNG